MDINNIRDALKNGMVRISDHADEEAAVDKLKYDEIFFAVQHGEIIEEYLSDRPFPSCLVYGRASNGDPIHSVWALNPATKWAVLITVYRPDPTRWINWRERRK